MKRPLVKLSPHKIFKKDESRNEIHTSFGPPCIP